MAKATTTTERKAEENVGGVPVEQRGGALTVVDFGDDAGKGMENVTSDEYRIPFWRILQSGSPEVRPLQNGGIAGAKAGMVKNIATGELWDGEKGFQFIPVYRDHNFIEWIPKDPNGAGGGFVGIHAPEEPIVGQLRAKHGRFGKLPMENGNELAETFYLYGLAIDPVMNIPVRGMIAFSSTLIPCYQTFVGRYLGIKYSPGAGKEPVLPPLWAHRWRMNTTMRVKGQHSWFIWSMGLATRKEDGSEDLPIMSLLRRNDPERPEDGMLYNAGREFYELIKSGKAVVDYAAAADTAADTATSGGAASGTSSKNGEDDIPM